MKTINYLPVLTVLIMFLAFVTPASLTAQESLTNFNTAALFGNDIDNFMDPNDYEKVEFESFFSEIQYDSFFGSQDLLTFGLAKKFGSTYTGFFFSGDIFQYNDDGPGATTNDDGYTIQNSLQVLIGTPAIGGIKLGFGIQGQDIEDAATGVSADFQIYTMMAGWGKNFELKSGSILKPEINAAMVLPSSGASATFPGFDPTQITNSGAGINVNLDNIFAVSLETDLVLVPKETVERIFSFEYDLLITKISMSGFGFSEKTTLLFHNLLASYKQIHPLTDNFSAAFNCGVDISYASIKIGPVSVSTTGFTPSAAAGFIYQFNSPFSVNAAVNVEYPITKLSGGGVSDTLWGGFTTVTTAGGSFEPNSSLAIDFSYSNGNAGYYNTNINALSLGVRFKR